MKLLCSCGAPIVGAMWMRCSAGCDDKTPEERRAERRREERKRERSRPQALYRCRRADGTSMSGGLLEEKFVMARTEKEALRKCGWNKNMGWEHASATRTEVIS